MVGLVARRFLPKITESLGLEKSFKIIQANHQPRTTSIIKNQIFPTFPKKKKKLKSCFPCFPRDASSPGLVLEHLSTQVKKRDAACAGDSSFFPGTWVNFCPSQKKSLEASDPEESPLPAGVSARKAQENWLPEQGRAPQHPCKAEGRFWSQS